MSTVQAVLPRAIRRTAAGPKASHYRSTYSRHLLGEYRAIPADRLSPEDRQTAEAVIERLTTTAIVWEDLFTFDLLIARSLPAERLLRKVWSLRSRYRQVAGIKEYEAYLASEPPEPSSTTHEAELRADIEFLLGELYLRYAMFPIREKARHALLRWVAFGTVVGLGFVLVFFLLAKGGNTDGPSILLAIYTGMMGGLFSLQQRFQHLGGEGDPVVGVSQLLSSRMSTVIAPMAGAVAAASIFLLFAGGMISGDLFPSIVDPVGTTGSGPARFRDFFLMTGPASSADYAKLMVWSFVAGFAERLVPDTLSRFADSKRVAQQPAE